MSTTEQSPPRQSADRGAGSLGTRLLIGQIDYLNCQPFYPLMHRHRLIATPPSDLGRLAANNEIDAGVLAVVDYLKCEDKYEPIAGLGIANHEEVRSILLASQRPIVELDGAKIGITEETSTSVRLLRTILEVKCGLRPERYVRGMREDADAFLVIGNEALARNFSPNPQFPYRYDLATEWWNWQRLPFVFALWIIRRSLPASIKTAFAELLEQSYQIGMSRVDEIGKEFAGELGSAETLASYLRNFHYRLGPQEMAGLSRFRQLCQTHRLLEPI